MSSERPRGALGLLLAAALIGWGAIAQGQTPEGQALRDALAREADRPGKAAWRPMLLYLAELHGRSVHPATGHFPRPYEAIGPGYQGGKVFGHIDLTHERLDTVRAAPGHARDQIRNELAGQQPDGLIPGVIAFDEAGKPTWKDFKGFPPVWVVSVDAYLEATGDAAFLPECLDALTRQIGWFEAKRAAPGGGFYYLDVTTGPWESGVDEGIRYDERPPTAAASVDATAHLSLLYDHAARWSRTLGRPHAAWDEKASALRRFIQKELWDPDNGFFYDRWTVRRPDRRHLAFEGMWPVVVGAATPEQAARVIDEHLLNPKEFFAPHPIATVALSDPKFELRMWRGPAWNCMTYWAARGCLRYGRPDAARRLLEAALDATATQFTRTGTVWEFYHPQGGDPESLRRKPKGRPTPCRDYVGHNPLLAMVDLWRKSSPAGLRDEAAHALKKAAAFYRGKVASHGGYVYYASVDLKQRWGEGKAAPETIFVQPPGTPTVGMAYLKAHAATGDPFCLDAARDAARALVYGQLASGGWTQVIDFDPGRAEGQYRNGKGGRRNTSSLDDGQTQAALRLLIRTDKALGFKDREIHEAALYGLHSLLKAQFPNGGFPQVWTGPAGPKPVVRAKYPDDDWRTEGRIKNYWDQYTLNDGLAGTVFNTLVEAHRVYRDAAYRAAIERLGDFLILAQMPDPQPAWCQQYNDAMVPIWARKFEPPAVTGWESQDVMETLIAIARYTGKPGYLEPIPRALAYLKASRLADGRMARYYELKTNRPLYMDARYRLTHDDSNAPGHYGWKQPARLEAIENAYNDARQGKGAGPPSPARTAGELERDVRAIIAELDGEGRWVSTYSGERLVGQPRFRPGFHYLSSERFSRNLETLSEYLATTGHKHN